MKLCRRFIQRLSAYVALALLAVPFAIIEPLKLIGLFVFGKGTLDYRVGCNALCLCR